MSLHGAGTDIPARISQVSINTSSLLQKSSYIFLFQAIKQERAPRAITPPYPYIATADVMYVLLGQPSRDAHASIYGVDPKACI